MGGGGKGGGELVLAGSALPLLRFYSYLGLLLRPPPPPTPPPRGRPPSSWPPPLSLHDASWHPRSSRPSSPMNGQPHSASWTLISRPMLLTLTIHSPPCRRLHPPASANASTGPVQRLCTAVDGRGWLVGAGRGVHSRLRGPRGRPLHWRVVGAYTDQVTLGRQGSFLWTTTGDGCAYPSIVVRDAAEVVLIRPAEGGLIWDLPKSNRSMCQK